MPGYLRVGGRYRLHTLAGDVVSGTLAARSPDRVTIVSPAGSFSPAIDQVVRIDNLDVADLEAATAVGPRAAKKKPGPPAEASDPEGC